MQSCFGDLYVNIVRHIGPFHSHILSVNWIIVCGLLCLDPLERHTSRCSRSPCGLSIERLYHELTQRVTCYSCSGKVTQTHPIMCSPSSLTLSLPLPSYSPSYPSLAYSIILSPFLIMSFLSLLLVFWVFFRELLLPSIVAAIIPEVTHFSFLRHLLFIIVPFAADVTRGTFYRLFLGLKRSWKLVLICLLPDLACFNFWLFLLGS